MNPRRGPTRARLRHRANQRPDVGGHRRSSMRRRLSHIYHRKPSVQAMTVSPSSFPVAADASTCRTATIEPSLGRPARRRAFIRAIVDLDRVVGCEILKLTEMLAANCQRVPHGTAMLPSVGSVLDEREPVVCVAWLRATVGGEFGKKWAAFW